MLGGQVKSIASSEWYPPRVIGPCLGWSRIEPVGQRRQSRPWHEGGGTVVLRADIAVGDFDEEPMEYEIDHVGLPPCMDWYTARCLTCGATRPFCLVRETAWKAIMKHAVERHGGLVLEGKQVLRISLMRRR